LNLPPCRRKIRIGDHITFGWIASEQRNPKAARLRWQTGDDNVRVQIIRSRKQIILTGAAQIGKQQILAPEKISEQHERVVIGAHEIICADWMQNFPAANFVTAIQNLWREDFSNSETASR